MHPPSCCQMGGQNSCATLGKPLGDAQENLGQNLDGGKSDKHRWSKRRNLGFYQQTWFIGCRFTRWWFMKTSFPNHGFVGQKKMEMSQPKTWIQTCCGSIHHTTVYLNSYRLTVTVGARHVFILGLFCPSLRGSEQFHAAMAFCHALYDDFLCTTRRWRQHGRRRLVTGEIGHQFQQEAWRKSDAFIGDLGC